MNALEIAQEFEKYLKEIEELPWGNHQILCDQAATMLRKQQAEIEALKGQLEPDPNVCTYCGFFKGYCTCPTWNNQK